MTIEQKAQRYDEALKRAKKLYEQGTITESLSYVFPELKESENERTRKYLISFVKLNSGVNLPPEDAEQILAWLEKQKPSDAALEYLKGNHSPSEMSDFQAAMNIAVAKAYDRGRADAIAEMQKPVDCTDCTNSKGCINCEDGNMKETLVQKPAWSEEDEEELDIAISTLKEAGQHDSAKWLKSLKERCTWKPSDEQLEALKNAIQIKPFENPSDSILWGLYEQLKKL